MLSLPGQVLSPITIYSAGAGAFVRDIPTARGAHGAECGDSTSPHVPGNSQLATCLFIRHHKSLSILLSRIDGDAPRAQAPDVWIVREQVSFTLEAALDGEHPNLILRTLPFAEAKSDSQLLFIPK